MLFGSLFKGDKGITIGKSRKRKLTARDVIDRLNGFELTGANCTLIRDHLGNEKIENYGQVDVFRLRDEEVFTLDNTFCITTPTGMKLKADVGGNLSDIISHETTQETSEDDMFDDYEDVEDEDEGDENESEGDESPSASTDSKSNLETNKKQGSKQEETTGSEEDDSDEEEE